MSGTKAGGAKAAATNKANWGDDFYKNIGRLGGKKGRTGGFYNNRELAREAGRKGGTISRRRPPKPKDVEEPAAHRGFMDRIPHRG